VENGHKKPEKGKAEKDNSPLHGNPAGGEKEELNSSGDKIKI